MGVSMKEIMVFYFAIISVLLAVMIKLEVHCWLAKRDLRKHTKGYDDACKDWRADGRG
jgi:hypothetical protein